MKKIAFVTAAVLALCLLAAGCASNPASAFLGPGNFYSDTVALGEKRGEATSRVFLGAFGKESYPAVERVAKENGIRKIATVEHYAKLGIFAIWTDYTTIVTGE
ncbi:MAG: TRL-like family protein [Treponema sp.]|nr:TRL-like family protein [Treponema sp.]